MDLKGYEKKENGNCIAGLTVTLTADEVERKGRSFTTDSESIRTRFYCYSLVDILNH